MSLYQSPHYNETFFNQQFGVSGGLDVIAALLVSLLSPKSVVDFGCGVGHMAAAMRSAGVPRVLGVDGPWVPYDRRMLSATEFIEHDFRHSLNLVERFDLAISLEVGEHLRADLAAGFIRELSACAPVVAFSAAIPHQGGTFHVNEQWPKYWTKLFREQGFVPLDCLRPRLLSDDRVATCYSQNLILYVSEDQPELNARLATDTTSWEDYPLPMVHPKVYAEWINRAENGPQRLGLFKVIKLLPSLAIQGMRRRIGLHDQLSSEQR